MRRLLAVTVALLLLAFGAGATLAKAPPSPAGATPAAAHKVGNQVILQGRVSAIHLKKGALTIEWHTTRKTVVGKIHRKHQATVWVKPETEVSFQGKSLTLAEIKKGSGAKITAKQVGRKLVAGRIEILKQPPAKGKPGK